MPSLCSATDYGQRSKVVPNQGKQQQSQGNRGKNDLKDKKGTVMFFLEDQKYKDKKVKDNPQPPENIKPGKGAGQQIISAVSTESKQSQIKGCEIKNSMEKK